MKRAFAIFLMLIMTGISWFCFAYDEEWPLDKGETVAPYPVLVDGFKLSFAQLDKQYLGRRCSVFFKVGQPTTITGIGDLNPAGKMFVKQGGITVENGELAGLSKHAIDVLWHYSSDAAHGGPIADTEIDYIMIEVKDHDPLPFVFYQHPVVIDDPQVVSAWYSGDTDQPYKKISGRDVMFPQLTKADLGLRCTVYLKETPPRYMIERAPKGMVITKGKTAIVNGEFYELGKHFLAVGWFNHAKHFFDPFAIAETEIDHVTLEKK